VLIGVAALLGAIFAWLSNRIAVLTRQRETLIGIVTMATLPLTFLSTALMQQSLLPDWIRWIAKFNPVNWAAEAGRSAAGTNADWGLDRKPRRLPDAAARQRRLRHPRLQRLPTLRLTPA
jgi:ABC-2 type transport system permease protein